jgi:hypothetical protein
MASKSAPKPPPSAARPLRESSGEQPRCVDTESFGHAQIINGGAQLCAQPCALDRKPQQGDDDRAA